MYILDHDDLVKRKKRRKKRSGALIGPEFYCTGVLVHPRFVMTSNKCATDFRIHTRSKTRRPGSRLPPAYGQVNILDLSVKVSQRHNYLFRLWLEFKTTH